MTRQEQIEEMAKIVDEMYNVYTTTADDIAEGLYNAGYRKIDDLKAEFKQLETNAEILARGVRDLNHENYELTEQVKQAKIDVLNELKEKCKFDGHTVAVYKNDIEEMIKELKK